MFCYERIVKTLVRQTYEVDASLFVSSSSEGKQCLRFLGMLYLDAAWTGHVIPRSHTLHRDTLARSKQ